MLPIWALALIGVAVVIAIVFAYFAMNTAKIAKSRARKMVKAKHIRNKGEFKWVSRVLKNIHNDKEAATLWNQIQALRAKRLL